MANNGNRSRLIWTLMVGTSLVASPSAGLGCGYHDDVALARGVLNWIYPDALYVVGAISAAVRERRLPAPEPGSGAPGLSGYHSTARALRQFSAQLRTHTDEVPPPAFSLLLVEPMLWTRFAPAGGNLQMRVHVSAPQAHDLVLISGETVIREIAYGRLTMGEAHRLRLIRFYGTVEQVARFLALYGRIGSGSPIDDSENLSQPQ